MEPLHFHALVETHANEHDLYLEVERYYARRHESRSRRRARMRPLAGWSRVLQALHPGGVRLAHPIAEQV